MDDITEPKPAKDEEKEKEKEKEEEEEDAPSLSDFPLNPSNGTEKNYSSYKLTQHKRRSSSEPSDFFEFFNDFTAEMSHAEDIIFRGQLVPYRNQHHHQFLIKSLSADDASRKNNRRSSSIELTPTIRSNSLTSTRPPRNPRYLDGKTLRPRHQNLMESNAADIRRSLSKSSARSEGSKASKPRSWFVLMFGSVKLHPEMDLRDIKNRQIRRCPGSMFPSMYAGGGIPASRSGRRSFWGFDLLRVLSCKSHASVAVTAPIGLPPRF